MQTDRALGLPTRSQVQQLELACRQRRITPEEREKAIATLTRTIDQARSFRLRIAASRALSAFESTEVRDVHHIERMQHEAGILDLRMKRAEEGKPNDSIAVHLVPVQELPLPPSLAGMRRRLLEPKEN